MEPNCKAYRVPNKDRLQPFCTARCVGFLVILDTIAFELRSAISQQRLMESMLTCNVGNPASRVISTRPIEKEGGSDETIKKVSAWLNECLHGQRRGKKTHANCPKPIDNYMPTRLIEIFSHADQYRLKLWESNGSVTEPYVALSYCWGGDQPLKLTQRWLNEWMVDIPWDQFPQTIKDAVTVCQKLDIRFLWVDSICIMQDDTNDKAVEIAQMPYIYRNSTLTIAASRAATVQAGFLGERTASNIPGAEFELPFQCKNSARLGSITLVKATIGPEPLDLRAWAMQERLLSPRTIEFGTRQLRFICQHNPRGVTDG
jgi:Heterokaryon incompatibility protein (HET)